MYTPYVTITLGLICVFVVPVFYYSYLQKKKKKKEIHKFSEVAKKRNLDLTFAESMPNLLIGLDATSGKLLAAEGYDGDKEQIVDLRNLISCEVQTVRSKPSGEINLIALQLGSNAKINHKIVFYNAGLEVHPDAERRLETAEKWQKIISANM